MRRWLSYATWKAGPQNRKLLAVAVSRRSIRLGSVRQSPDICLRSAISAALCATLLILCGCANVGRSISHSTERVTEDLLVTAALPVQVIAGAAEDAYTSSTERPLVCAPAAPLVFGLSTCKHTLVSSVYVADICAFPVYMWFGPDRIDIYDTGRFPFGQHENLQASTKRMSRDAAVFTAVPVAVPAGAAHDTYRYVHAHPVKGWIVTPGVFAADMFKHTEYALVHGADMTLYLLYFPFPVEPLEVYSWEEYPFEVAPRFNATANRFAQNFETFLTFPVMMWYHAGRSWKEDFDQHPVGMVFAAPFYMPFVGLYHSYLGVCCGIDSMTYPLLFWTGWGPVDLYNPGDLRLNPLRVRVVHHTSGAVLLGAVGTGEVVLGCMILMGEAKSECPKGTRVLVGIALIDHGIHTIAQGVSQAVQAERLSDLARKVPTNYRCRTALEILALALAQDPEEILSSDAYELGDRDERSERARDSVNDRLGDLISTAAAGVKDEKARQAAQERARRTVNSWADVIVDTSESLARADEALDQALARSVRNDILKRTGAISIAPADVGHIGVAPGVADHMRVMDGLLQIYHFPDNNALYDKILLDLDAVLRKDVPEDAWYRRCRKEVRRLQRKAYDRTGAYNVLASLICEGCVWLYGTIGK